MCYLLPCIASAPWIFTLAAVLSGVRAAALGSGSEALITCECTTVQCSHQGLSECTTGGLCFVQHLDRGQGSVVVRGCTKGRTPLLCENRRPSRLEKWPLLHCCATDFCNRDALPTPPSHRTDGQPIAFKTLQEIRHQNADVGNQSDVALPSMTQPKVAPPAGREGEESPASSLQKKRRSPWPHIVGPVYVSVLVLGIVSLVIIGIVAASVIRKSNRFYAERHYGTLQFRKAEHGVEHCDCDSEIDSVASSLSYLHVVRQSRDT